MTDESPEQQQQQQQKLTDNFASNSCDNSQGAVGFDSNPPPAQLPSEGIFSSGELSLLCPCVDFSEISFKEKVGHGSYGVVYKAVWRDRYVAVKEFGPKAEQNAIKTEVKQLSRVQHANIIALFGFASNQMSTYLIMEYAEGGSLYDFLHGKVKPHYTTSHAISWARQCAEGVAYLHAMQPKPLIHRDLKPLNLLLTNKGRHLKICDFGTVADKSTLMTNNKGSAAWMAPEVFEGSKYTEKCDIFSWGIVLWEVLSRQKPFKDVDNTYSIMWKIHKGERPPLIPFDFPDRIKNLITACWATKPELRPSMQLVVQEMNELVLAFPGADEPLEYEFKNQQIISPNANETTGDNYTLDFSTFDTSNTRLTRQSFTTTSSSTPTPTNASETNPFLPAVYGSVRWDVIPEEENKHIDEQENNDDRLFNLTPSEESILRNETIRREMMSKAANKVPLMPPLEIDVDPNAWELPNNMTFSKSDGKERITVTDTKPMLPTNADKTILLQPPPSSSETDETDLEDDEELNGQSWDDMLDPDLQPEQPIPGNAESQKIYREHRRLAKEFLTVGTELCYAQNSKDKILMEMVPAERNVKLELLKKMKEKEELLELYNNIKQQWESIQSGQQQQQTQQPQIMPHASAVQPTTDSNSNNNEILSDDSWVVIGHNQNS